MEADGGKGRGGSASARPAKDTVPLKEAFGLHAGFNIRSEALAFLARRGHAFDACEGTFAIALQGCIHLGPALDGHKSDRDRCFAHTDT